MFAAFYPGITALIMPGIIIQSFTVFIKESFYVIPLIIYITVYILNTSAVLHIYSYLIAASEIRDVITVVFLITAIDPAGIIITA